MGIHPAPHVTATLCLSLGMASLGLRSAAALALLGEHRPQHRGGRLGSLQLAPGLVTLGELTSLNLSALIWEIMGEIIACV